MQKWLPSITGALCYLLVSQIFFAGHPGMLVTFITFGGGMLIGMGIVSLVYPKKEEEEPEQESEQLSKMTQTVKINLMTKLRCQV